MIMIRQLLTLIRQSNCFPDPLTPISTGVFPIRKKIIQNRHLRDFDKAISINTRYTEAYNRRGIILNKNGDTSGALSDFNTAIELDPKYGAAYFNRGFLYLGQNSPDKAIDDFSRAIDLSPNPCHSICAKRRCMG